MEETHDVLQRMGELSRAESLSTLQWQRSDEAERCEDSAKLMPSTNVHDGDNRKRTTMAMTVVVMLVMETIVMMMVVV